jgi:hypothetical protein
MVIVQRRKVAKRRLKTKRGACERHAGSSVDEGRGAGFPELSSFERTSSRFAVPAPFYAVGFNKVYADLSVRYR